MWNSLANLANGLRSVLFFWQKQPCGNIIERMTGGEIPTPSWIKNGLCAAQEYTGVADWKLLVGAGLVTSCLIVGPKKTVTTLYNLFRSATKKTLADPIIEQIEKFLIKQYPTTVKNFKPFLDAVKKKLSAALSGIFSDPEQAMLDRLGGIQCASASKPTPANQDVVTEQLKKFIIQNQKACCAEDNAALNKLADEFVNKLTRKAAKISTYIPTS